MRTLERAMNSEHEELAARYADECARTLLEAHIADATLPPGSPAIKLREAWHRDALNRFEETFPRLEWRDHADQALLKALEENRP